MSDSDEAMFLLAAVLGVLVQLPKLLLSNLLPPHGECVSV